MESRVSAQPLFLFGACACGETRFEFAPLNRTPEPKQAKAERINGLRWLTCHCEHCRKHTGSAWATYLMPLSREIKRENGKKEKEMNGKDNCDRGFDISTEIKWHKRRYLKSVPTRCDGIRFSSLSNDGSCFRWFCAKCYSFLAMIKENVGEGDNSSEAAIAAGIILDGDYLLGKGRKPNEDLWPEKKFPGMLGTHTFDERCLERAAPWYLFREQVRTKREDYDKILLKVPHIVRQALQLNINDGKVVEQIGNFEGRGGCFCGRCRFACYTFPGEMQHCYCSLCRKYSGSAFQTWAPTNKCEMRWLPGSEKYLVLCRTTSFGQRHHCKMCATSMTIVYDSQPYTTWVAAGCLDDDCCVGVEASKGNLSGNADGKTISLSKVVGKTLAERRIYRVIHICCHSKQPWYTLPDNVGTERIGGAG
mmetsp:Transcript_11388/g.22369  ORF Transcript_11388/g.22369 Transcript_11388/m.22369 type:complete len:421 (+) Transcript_11388:190-1452(+)